MLSEDADKFYEMLVKELGNEIINDYVLSTSPSSSLPAFNATEVSPDKLD